MISGTVYDEPLFNKRYDLKVYTQEDNVDVNFLKRCENKAQKNQGYRLSKYQEENKELFEAARRMSRFIIDDAQMINNDTVNPSLTVDLFIETFLFKRARNQKSNLYKTIHLIRSVMYKFGPVFEDGLEKLVHKIFYLSTNPFYIRSGRNNFSDDWSINENLMKMIFADGPKLSTDYLRSSKEVGSLFKMYFTNPDLGINALMRNQTRLQEILYSILLTKVPDVDERRYFNSWHFTRSMFINAYLEDRNRNTALLAMFYKCIIFDSEAEDYKAIGKFVRQIFFLPYSMANAEVFIESDEEIGKRVVYLGASKNLSKQLYRTIRMIIVKKDQELPSALEYPSNQIENSLNQALGDQFQILSNLETVLEDLIIYNDPRVGNVIDKVHGDYIYILYKTLLFNDLKKEHSKLKKILANSSNHIHQAVRQVISLVVDNVDKDEEFRKIAVDYVKDTIVQSDEQLAITDENTYIKLFKLMFASEHKAITDNQKILNTESLLVIARTRGGIHSLTVDEVLKQTEINLDGEQIESLKVLMRTHNGTTSDFISQVDYLMREKESKMQRELLNEIDEEDRKIGVQFYEELYPEGDSGMFSTIENLLQEQAENKLIELQSTRKHILEVAYPGSLELPSIPIDDEAPEPEPIMVQIEQDPSPTLQQSSTELTLQTSTQDMEQEFDVLSSELHMISSESSAQDIYPEPETLSSESLQQSNSESSQYSEFEVSENAEQQSSPESKPSPLLVTETQPVSATEIYSEQETEPSTIIESDSNQFDSLESSLLTPMPIPESSPVVYSAFESEQETSPMSASASSESEVVVSGEPQTETFLVTEPVPLTMPEMENSQESEAEPEMSLMSDASVLADSEQEKSLMSQAETSQESEREQEMIHELPMIDPENRVVSEPSLEVSPEAEQVTLLETEAPPTHELEE